MSDHPGPTVPAIEDYAVIGDGRTVAVLSRAGSIDWWPIPRLDSPPVLARLIDPGSGGYFSLRPEADFSSARRYLPRTNVIETTYVTPTGIANVTDSLNVGSAGRLPWTELARRVTGVQGEVAFGWEFAPGDRFGVASPYVRQRGGAILVDVADQRLAVLSFDAGEPVVGGFGVRGQFTATAGSSRLLAVVGSDAEPLFLPERDEVCRRLDGTVSAWERFSELVDYEDEWREAVMRSMLALKLLIYAPRGSIAAAATTSLPERLGGPKNWDYRFAWIRDSALSIEALMALGLHEETQAAVSWLLGAIGQTAPDLHVFYRLDGSVANSTRELDARGYRESAPVRAGNSAAGQRQLGTFGDLFAVMARYVKGGHVLDHPTAVLLFEIADRCCDSWRNKDAGIWELGEYRHYTISKMQCWAALQRAVELVDGGHLDSSHRARWQAESDHIRSYIEERCWSERQRSYTFYAGSEELDASVLLAGRLGYEDGGRLECTIDACRRELGEGPFLYRYSGMGDDEGAFIACSFWLVDALVRVGRGGEAVELMTDLVALCNDVGLLSEQQDPTTGNFLGNFPQGLSHLSLINAAALLSSSHCRTVPDQQRHFRCDASKRWGSHHEQHY